MQAKNPHRPNVSSRWRQISDAGSFDARLCRKTPSGFERPFSRLAVPMYIKGCIDDKTNIACFSSLGVARDRLCQAEKLLALAPDTGAFRQSLVLCPVVNHEDFVQMWAQDLAELLVGRVGQVLRPVGFAAKAHEEAMGESLLEALNTHIRAPL